MANRSFPQTIWFIDDDEIINHVNKRLCELCNFGNKVYTFSSPVQALSNYSICVQNNHDIPDLIFLDFMMPKIDGIQFLEKLEQQSNNLYKRTRIIFLSSTESEADIDLIRSKLETKFLSKPLTKAHIDSLKLFFFFERPPDYRKEKEL